MRNFLILLSFTLVLGSVGAGFAEEMQPATPEEEAVAKATLGQIDQDFEDGASKDELIQRYLQLRDQYPNTKLTAASASSEAGFQYYRRQYKLQEAAECYEWVLARYPDLPDSLWEMEDLTFRVRVLPEGWWEAWRLRYTYGNAVASLAHIYYSMERFEEAAVLFNLILAIEFGEGIQCVVKLSEGDLTLIKEQCFKDYHKFQKLAYPGRVIQEVPRQPNFYTIYCKNTIELAKMMLCVIELKQSKED